MKVCLSKTFDFEAAHAHPPGNGMASRVHGHRFYVQVSQTGEIDPVMGWLIDYGQIKASVKPVINQLDHRFLNDLEGLNSGTPEDIGTWIKRIIRRALPFPVEVAVTCRESLEYEPTLIPPDTLFKYPERISFRFEAAHSLPETPEGHKCRRLHGHSYEVQIARETTAGPGVLSAGSGATETAGAGVELLLQLLSQSLKKIHGLLNYTHLNQIPGLENPTAEILCGWIWRQLEAERLTPTLVAVGETCESRCDYRGE